MNRFTKKYLIGALLSGLFIGIGVNPEQVIINAFIEVVESLSPVFAIVMRVFFSILGIILSIKFWIAIKEDYGKLGIIIASGVFLGAFLLVLDITFGVWLLIIGIILGQIVVK